MGKEARKIYLQKNVYEMALERIRWVFDEFPITIVNVSGGKDSTVMYNLVMQVAKEKKRFPQRVMFIDQEAEWDATIDQIKSIMYNSDVKPMWLQFPFALNHNASSSEHWFYPWDDKHKELWMREKDPISIQENITGEQLFQNLFIGMTRAYFKDTPVALFSGIRTEESPSRFMGLTTYPTYKWVTWGRIGDKKLQHYSFYPLYDWSFIDIWKSIFSNKWNYNKLYDYMFSIGIPLTHMRVSSLNHETALWALFMLQEIEPETYNRMTLRMKGIDMAGEMGWKDFYITDLPFMFSSWKEYRDYLLEHLIKDELRDKYKHEFEMIDKKCITYFKKEAYQAEVNTLLANDFLFIKLKNFTRHKTDKAYLKLMKKEGLLSEASSQ